MDLLIVPSDTFKGTPGGLAVNDHPELLATGLFEDMHPPDWRNAVFTAAQKNDGSLNGLIIVISPNDYPGLGPRERYRNPLDAVRDLWIFKASIAAAHVAAPHPDVLDDPRTSRMPFEAVTKVTELTGIEQLESLARMADAGGFKCIFCKYDGVASKTSTVAVVFVIAGRPVGQELTLVHLAHRTCSSSCVLVIAEDDMQLAAASTVIGTSALLLGRHGRQRPVVIIDFLTSLTAGPDGPDLLVRRFVTDGMAVMRDLRREAPLASGFTASIRGETLSLWDPRGTKILIDLELSIIPAWREIVRRKGEVTVLAGSGLGLESGQDTSIVEMDRIIEVARLGRLVGARIQVRLRD
jgi:hypothetical protein